MVMQERYGKNFTAQQLAMKALWDSKDVCAAMNIGRTTLTKLTNEKKIPSLLIGRRRLYPKDAVLDWLNGLVA